MKNDKQLDRFCRALCKCFLTVILVASGASSALAQREILADPMRPANVSDGIDAKTPTAAPAGVQLILTSPARKLALIDGKVVPLGGEARDGTLVGVSEAGAVLRKGDGRDVLLLHPNIDKRPPGNAKATR